MWDDDSQEARIGEIQIGDCEIFRGNFSVSPFSKILLRNLSLKQMKNFKYRLILNEFLYEHLKIFFFQNDSSFAGENSNNYRFCDGY